MKPNSLTINPEDGADVLRGLASPIRVSILSALDANGPLNVNEISSKLDLPQSTVVTNVQVLEEAGLITTEMVKASCWPTKDQSIAIDSDLVPSRGQ